ncbi:aminotransferase class I/II-fold pyridoxal phosphate-dependent enzyme [Sphingobacterium lactis]|uniref:aminotransferase class I/II-fold pyridoxal phosphate-dependent enzyme n=1 Tax=Sphingobacterium lactis TaxID=797291 RepID=UPI003DA5F949
MQTDLSFRLQEVKERGTYRSLRHERGPVDFCSNEYLGYTQNRALQHYAKSLMESHPHYFMGSTGSRLISGNHRLTEEIEACIADHHEVQSAMLFPTGYMANLTLFSTLPQRGDTVILDEYVHRSVLDGCRMGAATRWKFRHNDLNHLEDLLARAKGRIWIGVESLYSMDGDLAPLVDMAALAQRYGSCLLVDEAHALGVFGLGLVKELGLSDQIFASVVTYGKAFGQHGAALLGSQLLKDYLVNFGSPFIYSTAMPIASGLLIQHAYAIFQSDYTAQEALADRVRYFEQHALGKSVSGSPIKPIYLSKDACTAAVLNELEDQGISCSYIKSPTVPKGKERIRVCLHAFNTHAEIDSLVGILKKYQ